MDEREDAVVRQPNPISGLNVALEYKVFLMLIIDV